MRVNKENAPLQKQGNARIRNRPQFNEQKRNFAISNFSFLERKYCKYHIFKQNEIIKMITFQVNEKLEMYSS